MTHGERKELTGEWFEFDKINQEGPALAMRMTSCSDGKCMSQHLVLTEHSAQTRIPEIETCPASPWGPSQTVGVRRLGGCNLRRESRGGRVHLNGVFYK